MYLKSYCLMTCLMTISLTKPSFLRRLGLAASSVQAIIRSLLSSVLDTGIIVEVKTRKPVFTHPG